MARKFDTGTLLKMCMALALLCVAAGGAFFVLAPYQASQLGSEIVGRLYAQGEDPLVLATAAEDGAYYKLGGVLRQHLDASHSYELDVRATLGSVENLQLLHEQQADLALIQGGLAAERAGVVALANLGRQYLHLVVPADSAIEDFRDLAGKRLGVGPKGSGSEALAESVMAFFNFTDESTVVYDHNPELREAFLDDEIDAAFTVYGLFSPAMERLLGEGWYRLVPVREAEAVSRFLPGVFAEELPPSLYGPDRSIPPDSGAPFQTLAVNTLLVAREGLPDRQVYAVLGLIFSGDFLRAAQLTDLDETVAQTALHLPQHPAADAFYSRNDPISADRFEILSFFLAGIVCLVSVVHYLLGYHRHRVASERRGAIRPYFEAMMDFGDAIESAAHPTGLTRLIHKIMATQRGAEREWLEGHFDTEDMENLYAVYGLRCDTAFNKIFDMHLQSLRGMNTVAPARDGAPGRNGEEEPFSNARFPRVERDAKPAQFGSDDRGAAHPAYPRVERDEKPAHFAAHRDAAPEAVYPRVERDEKPDFSESEDDFFAGSALAGIDVTKSEIAEKLPSRYDPGLLYDTGASGAGSVRVRKSKPQADLHAVVERDVPVRTAAARPIDQVDDPAVEAARRPDTGIPVESEPELEEEDEDEDKPDQLMLF